MTWRNYFEVPDRRPPWLWAAECLRLKGSPLGSRFAPDLTPWIKEPLEAFADNRNQEITAQCCVQGGKTTLLVCGAAHATRFDPDPMMITCQTDDDAKFFAKERMRPALEGVPEIRAKLPEDKSKNSTLSLSLPDMFIEIQGANENNLQSKPVRWVLNDEVYLWAPGLLQQARNRTTRFWNRRILNVSTAGVSGCDLDQAFREGDQREYFLSCPSCLQVFNPKWECIKWPKQDDWNWSLLKQSVRLECPLCKVQHAHTSEIHRKMLAGAKYVPQNPNNTPGKISFHWNALVLSPEELSWGDLAVEWVKAEIEYEKGNDYNRREFITKRLAESYDPNRYVAAAKLPVIEISSDWKDEAYRFLTVDVQQTEFWATVRAWSRTGASRLLWAGKLFSFEEIEDKANELKVTPACVFVDSSWDTRKVYLECAKRNKLMAMPGGKQDWVGWKCLNGEAEARKNFVYKPKNGRSAVLLPYSFPPRYVDPLSGQVGSGRTYAKLYFWSNLAIKEILWRLRNGKGSQWLAYEGVPQDWHDQMFSERPIWTRDKLGKETRRIERIGNRPNHLWDCECMQVVAACIAGCIGTDNPTETQ